MLLTISRNAFSQGKKEGLTGMRVDQVGYHGYTGEDKEKYISGYIYGLTERHNARIEAKRIYNI